MSNSDFSNKVKKGDYVTLAKMLNISPAAAKMRVRRGNQEAQEAMAKIIEAREELIEKFKHDQPQ